MLAGTGAFQQSSAATRGSCAVKAGQKPVMFQVIPCFGSPFWQYSKSLVKLVRIRVAWTDFAGLVE